jgi:hypothetical protein
MDGASFGPLEDSQVARHDSTIERSGKQPQAIAEIHMGEAVYECRVDHAFGFGSGLAQSIDLIESAYERLGT